MNRNRVRPYFGSIIQIVVPGFGIVRVCVFMHSCHMLLHFHVDFRFPSRCYFDNQWIKEKSYS